MIFWKRKPEAGVLISLLKHLKSVSHRLNLL